MAMANVVYGVWDGVVHDHRGQAPGESPEFAELEDFDVFNEGNPIRAFVSDRGFLVFDERTGLVDALWRYMEKAAEQSCGKCTPCRMGRRSVRDALGALRRGERGALHWNRSWRWRSRCAPRRCAGSGRRARGPCWVRWITSAT